MHLSKSQGILEGACDRRCLLHVSASAYPHDTGSQMGLRIVTMIKVPGETMIIDKIRIIGLQLQIIELTSVSGKNIKMFT